MVPQMHTEVWEHAKGRVTPPAVTDGAAECARAVLVDEFGHRAAQQVAAHRCKMVIGMLRSSYRTNELDNLLWRGHES